MLGLDMSCCMVWDGRLFQPDIVIGCIGLSGVAATYPIYNHIVKQDREKSRRRSASERRTCSLRHGHLLDLL